MSRACRNCQWWSDPPPTMPDGRPAGFGVCRGGPPTPGAVLGQWPVTMGGEWCGAFRTAERLAGGVTDAEFEDAHRRMGERLAGIGKGTEQ